MLQRLTTTPERGNTTLRQIVIKSESISRSHTFYKKVPYWYTTIQPLLGLFSSQPAFLAS